jgi:hypothetical protein
MCLMKRRVNTMLNKIASKTIKSIKVSSFITVLALTALFLIPGQARAELIGTLTYVQPTGTVGPNDSVTVWLKFSLDANSDPLTTGTNANITSHSFLNGLDLYGGGLTTGISGFPNPPYSYVWGPGPGPIQDWDSFWSQFNNLDLKPGDTFTYADATYIPNGGPVPAGTYTSTFDGFEVWGPDQYQQTDSDGNPLFDDTGAPVMADYLHEIATTRGFSRTVEGSTVPEPTSLLLIGSGLIGLAGFRKNFFKK